MAGVFGPGECSEAGLQGITNLLDSTHQLFNPNSFTNPQAENILNMFNGSTSVREGLMTYMSGPPPLMGPGAELAQNMMGYLDHFDAASSGFEKWTNFLSGKSSTFPDADLAATFNYLGRELPAQWPLLAGFGFVGLVGIASGATRIAYVKCEVDPSDPCARINRIFAAIMGAVNTVLNVIISGFNTMVDFATKILDYITQLLAFIDNLVSMIMDGIAALIEALVQAIRYGLAKLFGALKLDPCMMAVMQQICGTDLRAAIGV